MRKEGLGDTIEAITQATGIKKIVDWFANGKDCGCEKRRELLNKLVPYKRRKIVNCLTEKMYNDWHKFRQADGLIVTGEEAKLIAKIHAHLFGHKVTMPCKCSPKKWAQWVKEINGVFEAYEKPVEPKPATKPKQAPRRTKSQKPKPKTTGSKKTSTAAKKPVKKEVNKAAAPENVDIKKEDVPAKPVKPIKPVKHESTTRT